MEYLFLAFGIMSVCATILTVWNIKQIYKVIDELDLMEAEFKRIDNELEDVAMRSGIMHERLSTLDNKWGAFEATRIASMQPPEAKPGMP